MGEVIDDINILIKEIADINYVNFYKQGYASAGNNGPYRFIDTPVRNTSHWLIIYSYLWKCTKDEKYMKIAIILADYLVSEQKKSKSGAIECMSGEHFDHLNGLIGQAWVVEALVYAYITFKKNDYLNSAFNIFNSQLFDVERALWKRVELDGSVCDFDYTLNHQVWFAASGMIILEVKDNQEIRRKIEMFLDKLSNEYFDIYKSGLIKHYGTINRPKPYPKIFYIKRKIKDLCIPMKKIYPNKFDSKVQEKGYHLFELYGYAIVHKYYPDHELFKKLEFTKALKYGLNLNKLNKIYNLNSAIKYSNSILKRLNKFTYGYNSPAFEYPLVQYEFCNIIDKDKILQSIEIQKKLMYNQKNGKMDRNNYDSETLTARVYELVRYCDLILSNKNRSV